MAKPSKKKEAIILLAQNISQTRVTEMIGVDRRTIVRWLKDDTFRKQLNDNRKEYLENVLDKVIDNSVISIEKPEESESSKTDSLLAKAIAALDAILSCPESRNSDRIRASELILKLVGSDRIAQSVSGGNSLESPVTTVKEDRTAEIERLLERRKLLMSRMSVLKSQKS